MKLYAIKRNDGKYKTETSEYLKEIWFAELFNDYEISLCYCPSDCKIIECELMETTELADHEKQVRKRVCEEIREAINECRREYYSEFLVHLHPLKEKYYRGYDFIKANKFTKKLDQIEKGE